MQDGNRLAPFLVVLVIILNIVVATSGCGGGRAARAGGLGSEQQEGRLRIQVGPYGDLSVKGKKSADPEQARRQGPRWLQGLRQGDVLVYGVRLFDDRQQIARLKVQKLVRRDQGVAVRMEPDQPAIGGPKTAGYWIAGDKTGLFRLEAHDALADPGFVPLDEQGRVLPDGRDDARWSIPAEWKKEMEGEAGQQEPMEQGWVVDELELMLDGPVRGDGCARISRTRAEGLVRVVVCANIGIVELQSGSSEVNPEESWKLVAVENAE